MRNVADLRVSSVDKHKREDEEHVRLCNYVDVYNNDRITAKMNFMHATATTEEIERYRLERGDVLVTKDSETWDDIGVPAMVSNSAPDLISGYHLALLRPRSEYVVGGYLFRALESKGVSRQFHVRARGVTRYGLTHVGIKSVWLPVPPLPEQEAIVRFLDHADRRIQRYIRAKQRLIALLEERRQVIIHQAVTGKIDVRTGQPYPAYMPSGVEGLQDVPVHWELHQIGRFGRLFKGSGGTKEDDIEFGVPCIRYGDLYTQHQFFITASRACVAPEAASEYTPVRYGDVLFAGSGETIDEIGKSAVNLIRGSACCGGDVIILRTAIDVDARFLGYATDCPQAAQQKARMGRGITVIHIYGSELKRLTVALPPLPEQRGIVRFLDRTTGNLTAGIDAARRQIERVREYRIRLIADVVTGEVDVRDAVAELPADDSADRAEDSADEHAVDREAIV